MARGRGLRLKNLSQIKKTKKGIKVVESEPLESTIQINIMKWAEDFVYKDRPLSYYLHHSPNGGYRNKLEAAKFKAMGVKAGYPDIICDIARNGYHGLRIELKRTENEEVSDYQADRIKSLREEGYKAEVCKGFEAATEILKEYLGGSIKEVGPYHHAK